MSNFLTRRDLGRLASFFLLGGLVPAPRAAAAQASAEGAEAALETSPNAYRSLGVRPIINCRGTITVIGGSIELPEVSAAKVLANQQHVPLDELIKATPVPADNGVRAEGVKTAAAALAAYKGPVGTRVWVQMSIAKAVENAEKEKQKKKNREARRKNEKEARKRLPSLPMLAGMTESEKEAFCGSVTELKTVTKRHAALSQYVKMANARDDTDLGESKMRTNGRKEELKAVKESKSALGAANLLAGLFPAGYTKDDDTH